METQIKMLVPAVDKLGDKMDAVLEKVSAIATAASEQKGKADAKFGFTDMAMMVVLGAIGSYLVGTTIA